MGEMIIAVRFARALFEIAGEEFLVAQIDADLKTVVLAVSENLDWVEIMNSEYISLSQRKKMAGEVLAAETANQYVINLVKLLVEKRRVALLPDIYDCFHRLAVETRGEVRAHVIVSDPEVWEILKEEIGVVVGKMTGHKPILEFEVDPKIVGGLIIRVGDKVYDGSVKGELERLQEKLSGEMYEIQ